MVLHRNSYKPLIAVFLLGLATPAMAAETLKPMAFTGRYIIAWSGIPLGRIILTAHEDATSYSMIIDTKTKGIGALISDEKRLVSAQGIKTDDGVYVPQHYQSRPHKKEDRDTITLTYDAAGDIAKRENDNEDDPAWRPPVPNEQINSARDPITAAFMLRRELYDALANPLPEVSTRTYDGERLATMSLVRSKNSRVEVMNHYIDTVNVIVKRAPINGYTPKELKKYKKGDPEIRIYFSNDAEFLPVRATAKVPLGELSMTLVEKQ